MSKVYFRVKIALFQKSVMSLILIMYKKKTDICVQWIVIVPGRAWWVAWRAWSPAVWASLSPAKATRTINHHTALEQAARCSFEEKGSAWWLNLTLNIFNITVKKPLFCKKRGWSLEREALTPWKVKAADSFSIDFLLELKWFNLGELYKMILKLIGIINMLAYPRILWIFNIAILNIKILK